MVRSATREPIAGEDALALLEGVTDLWVAKGPRVVEIDLRGARPSDEELLSLMLGRSGTLRAPTLKAGARLIVGYNANLLSTALL